MLQEALMAQRQMLVDAIGKRAEDIPQAFTPYNTERKCFRKH